MDYMPIIPALLGYALGSIPFGLILAKLSGAGDLRQIGSGNIGATNVMRAGGKGLGAACMALDIGKGVAAVLLARFLFGVGDDFWTVAISAGAGAFIGHCYPIWLGFKGGKGVATYAGILFGLYWPLGLTFAVIWLGLLLLVRISSVGGLVAALSAPIAAALFGIVEIVPVLAILTLICCWKHRENIERIVKGEEPRIGSKKTS